MKIKKFIAPSMQDALKQIKQEFGDDAIILSSKPVEDKKHPEWQNAIEVSAAIDKKEDDSNRTAPPQRELIRKQDTESIPANQFSHLQKEIQYMGERLESLINHVKYENLPHIPKTLQNKVKQLIANGVNASIANQLIEEIFMNVKGEDLMEEELIEEKLISRIKNLITISGPIKFNPTGPTVVMIIGPTGVGKTTTIAKLAAMYKYTYNKKVTLLSTDSFRIAAMEQLKTFAEIARINFVSAYNHQDLIEKMNKLNRYDLILIDAAGVNTRNIKQLVALKELTKVARADEIQLALSITTRTQDLRESIKSFSIIPITGITYTKLDESSGYGDILNLCIEYEKPLSYLTFGQNIPEDIVLANRNEIAMTILRGKYGNV